MVKVLKSKLLLFILGFGLLSGILNAETPRKSGQPWWKNRKIKIFVDKVYSRNAGRLLHPEAFAAIKKAGFNVICDRWHGKDLKKIEEYGNLAEKNGLKFLPWLRGTLAVKGNGLKLVTEDGLEVGVYSPNSDELWAYLHKWILSYARLSLKVPIVGVFLDFELYARPKPCNAYPVSYDNKILGKFCISKEINMPQLAPSKRYKWLKAEGLLDEFCEFQVSEWRNKCRNLRKEIDKINPYFQIVLYGGEHLVSDIAIPEWSTLDAPVIIATSGTYGLSSPLLSQVYNLKSNQNKLLDSIAAVRKKGFPFIIIGGIDPVCAGEPEFSGKNAVSISELCNGYWVFYEGFKPDSAEHREQMKWFSIANQDIDNNRFVLYREPIMKQESLISPYPEKKTNLPQVGLYGTNKHFSDFLKRSGQFEPHPFKSLSLAYLKRFDVVVLQNFNVALPMGSYIHKILIQYVEEGGGLLLTHDTGWYFASPFPDIAVRAYPEHKVSSVRHVLDTRMVIAAPDFKDIKKGTRYNSEFMDHMIFFPGQAGRVLVKNHFDESVYVTGQYGKGRVVFSGSYYRKPPEGIEGKVLLDIFKWLSKKGK